MIYGLFSILTYPSHRDENTTNVLGRLELLIRADDYAQAEMSVPIAIRTHLQDRYHIVSLQELPDEIIPADKTIRIIHEQINKPTCNQ